MGGHGSNDRCTYSLFFLEKECINIFPTTRFDLLSLGLLFADEEIRRDLLLSPLLTVIGAVFGLHLR